MSDLTPGPQDDLSALLASIKQAAVADEDIDPETAFQAYAAIKRLQAERDTLSARVAELEAHFRSLATCAPDMTPGQVQMATQRALKGE